MKRMKSNESVTSATELHRVISDMEHVKAKISGLISVVEGISDEAYDALDEAVGGSFYGTIMEQFKAISDAINKKYPNVRNGSRI